KFRWNSQNQLTGVLTPGGQQWDYRYDAFGRRTEKICEQTGMRTTYLWDGDQPAEIREYRHHRLYSIRHLVFDGWQLLAQQIQFFTPNPENRRELIADEVQTQYAVCAPTGEPLALFDPQGHRVWRQPPQSLYGMRLKAAGENAQFDPEQLYAGQWLDQESGLVYNRFRYYSSVAGQYLTPDPIGLAGGENPYAYVENPTGWVDPLGLAGCSTKLGKNMMEEMGLPRSTTWKGHEAHHVIPKDFSDHPALKAIKYDIDDAANGIFLRRPDRVVNKKIATTVSPMARHRGNHFGYSDAVEKALNKIDLKQPVDAIAKQVADIQIKAKKAMMNGLPIRAKDIVNGDSKLGNKRAFELWDKVFNK
ncbi:AHH domain-containing protein, partial [Xenorhabdus bovienii]|uniref:AHH domain-containing protein n=1 Tax=Xenorhabdus bovienii TaxID=40576 RepID=UPI0023B2C03E